MNLKYLFTTACLAFPIAAVAQSDESASGSSTLTNSFFAIVPFLILGVILFFFFRRVQS